jgi:hypothetical protein
MQYEELVLGANNIMTALKNKIETDGPVTIVLENGGDSEFALAIKQYGDTYCIPSAPALLHSVALQQQISKLDEPDGAEVAFAGVARGAHASLYTSAIGSTSAAPADRLFTDAGGVDFLTEGVRPGDVLQISDAGDLDDNGSYLIEHVHATTLLVERDWPAGAQAGLTYDVYKRCVVMPGSFRWQAVFASGVPSTTIVVTDNGAGVLYGLIKSAAPATHVHGTINYFTGKWEITCDTAPDNVANGIYLTYAEALPVVPGGKISFPISNVRHGKPLIRNGGGAALPRSV